MLVVSLIGGAGGAAIINMVYGMKKQKQDRIDEHARWLRDKKLEVYSEFFGASFSAFDSAPLAPPEGLDEALDVVRSTSLTAQAKVRLLAAEDVGTTARDAYSDLLEYVKITVFHESEDPERDNRLKATGRKFIDSMSRFLDLARKDLDQTP